LKGNSIGEVGCIQLRVKWSVSVLWRTSVGVSAVMVVVESLRHNQYGSVKKKRKKEKDSSYK